MKFTDDFADSDYSELKILAIDFDGTITINDKGKILGIRTDAVKYINTLYLEGFKIIIWTCREGERLVIAKDFLDENDIMYHTINNNIIQNSNFHRKVYAHIYIDDKQLWPNGKIPEWKKLYKLIHKNLKRKSDG